MKKTNNRGFSLIELIVVIAIMAVLVGALTPQFIKYVERGRKSVDVQNVATIVSAVKIYAADPMVDSAAQIENGATITLTGSQVDVVGADGLSSNCTGNADKALTAAGIKTIGLQSGKWGDGTKDTVKLTITVDGAGNVTVTSDTVDKKNDILAGKYE